MRTDFPKAGLMVMMRSKATHSAASLAFQSMWGSYLAGWMADQRLTGFRTASAIDDGWADTLGDSDGISDGIPVLEGLMLGWLDD